MLNRRSALSILGTAGIGTAVFQRALAATADDGLVTPQMVAEAEWVAGITLTPAQREAAVKSLNKFGEPMKRVRAIELVLYTNLAGHPVMVFPHKFEKESGLLMPQAQMLTGRAYDESTLLAVADACQRAIGLKERPPLDEFLAQKEEILKDEKFPDETKLYTD